MLNLTRTFIFSLVVSFFLFADIADASKYITKKSKTSEETEQIDKMYADGLLTKSECIKAKTKVLKLKKEIKTICDNVEVKVVKKKPKEETSSSFITKKNKEEKKKALKEHKKKKKDLSKEAKSYITKKKTETKHLESIAQLPDSEFYFFAVDEANMIMIGFVNQDKNSKTLTVGAKKFKKGNKGMAYLNDGKTICSIYSEVDDDVRSERIYTGKTVVDCEDGRNFIGNWVQKDETGQGIGIDKEGTTLEFNFSMNRKLAIASFDKMKKGDTRVAKIIEDDTKYTSTKKVKKRFKPKIITKLEIKSKETCFVIEGSITNKDYLSSKQFFLEIDGEAIENKKGEFSEKRCSLKNKDYFVRATNEYGKYEEVIVKVKIDRKKIEIAEKLEELFPNNISVKINKNRVAVIIGIENYKTAVKASYANQDAQWFSEYARKAFGVSDDNMKILIDEKATLIESKKTLFSWLRGKIKENQTELIVFFSGHGLAGDEGRELYLLTQDSETNIEELEWSALKRTEMIKNIEKFKPKKVTMFFDACYSGTSRDNKALLAQAKQIQVKVREDSSVPDNFTIFSASKASQVASSMNKPNHGIFSYFLMKGVEGKADEDKDRKITYQELFKYLQTSISERALQLGRQQNPSLILGQNIDSKDIVLRY